jgi:protein dithiol:quinone oxidoreductase
MERHNGSTAARAPSLLNRRAINLLGGLAAVLLMGYALYEQHVVGLQPCHLCILQRIAVLGLGVVFLLAAAHDPGDAGARIYAVLLAVVAGAGLAAAGRHVWLQLQPAGSVPACGADLTFMLKVLPLKEVLVKVFQGGAECQTVDWRLLGLSMPAWVFIALAALGSAGVWANWRRALRPA